jgi:hypothetical protein
MRISMRRVGSASAIGIASGLVLLVACGGPLSPVQATASPSQSVRAITSVPARPNTTAGQPSATSSAPVAVPTACGSGWTTAAKQAGPDTMPGQVLTDTRGVGRNSVSGCNFDRVVFFTVSTGTTKKAGYSVRYVPQALSPGQGAPLPLAGAYKLEVVINVWAANAAFQPTYFATARQDLPNVVDGARVVDTVFGGSHEGKTTIGIGLSAKRPFRVVAFTDGRVAVDFLY